MKCRNCGYTLWNLTEPRCPECGHRFDVQSYWFPIGSVVFKCPFCGHRHPGRDARGLPFDAGRCEGCGQMLVVEQMPVEPVDAAHPVEPESDDDQNPFLRRKRPQNRRVMLAVAVAIGACILWFVIMYLFATAA